jgi:Competence protein CoiA-like family
MVDVHLAGMLVRFALFEGREVNIREYDHYRGSAKGRPEGFVCPECNEEVVLVLPKQNIEDHFRHLPGSACRSAAGGESAVHLNAKAFLTQKLNAFHSASLVYRCGKCTHWYPYLRIENYDRAQAEWTIGRRRPDIACLSGSDVVIGAAEIYYTHAVDDEKKGEFSAAQLKWFEIGAGQVLAGKYFGHVESADILSIDAQGAGISYPLPPVVCEACQELARKEEYRRRQEALRREQERLKREHDLQLQREQEAQRREELRIEQQRQREALEVERQLRYEEWRRKEDEKARVEAERRAKEETERAEAERVAREAERLARQEAARAEAEYAAFLKTGGRAYLTSDGELRGRDFFRQPMWETLAVLKAPLRAWRLHAHRDPDLLSDAHRKRCDGEPQQGEGFIFCVNCGYYFEQAEL